MKSINRSTSEAGTVNRGLQSKDGSRLHAMFAAGVLAVGLCMAATTASATAVLSGSVGGVPAGADAYENFDTLALDGTGGVTPTGITVAFVTDAGAVQGAVDGKYAAPFLSNGNGTLFGDPSDGADTTIYLTTGSGGSNPKAHVSLTFASPQRYFGLLWGSVDNYNTLDFYSSGVNVASFGGADVSKSAGLGNCTAGDQGKLGTCYVNINFLTGSFDEVRAHSSSYAFEFDNVAFSANPIGVPEPGTAGIFLLGLLLLGSSYWLKGRRVS
jgi:hypothetical protein